MAFKRSSSLCCFLERMWTWMGVTPLAKPTANTSHSTGRTGCALTGFFMQMCACINAWIKHTHTHTNAYFKSGYRHAGSSRDYAVVLAPSELFLLAYYSHSHPLIYVMRCDVHTWHKSWRVSSLYFCPEVFSVQHVLWREYCKCSMFQDPVIRTITLVYTSSTSQSLLLLIFKDMQHTGSAYSRSRGIRTRMNSVD